MRPSSETLNVLRDKLPQIQFTELDLDREYTDHGSVGIVRATYNLDIYTNKATDAHSLLNAIRGTLDGYKGTTAETQIERIYFGRAKLLQGSLTEGSNLSLARYAAEMFVAYRD